MAKMKRLMLFIVLLFVTICSYSQTSNHFVNVSNSNSNVKGYWITTTGRSTSVKTMYKSAPTERKTIGGSRKNRMARKLYKLEKTK